MGWDMALDNGKSDHDQMMTENMGKCVSHLDSMG